MSGIVFVNMCNCLFYGRNNLHRNDCIQVLCAPVFFCCRHNLRYNLASTLIPPDFYAFFTKRFINNRNGLFCDFFMNHKWFTCIAYAETLCLCIYNNRDCHVKVCSLVHKNVTVSSSCLNDRNCTVLHYICNESCPASRNQNINVFIQFHHLIYDRSVCIFNKKDCVLRKITFFQTVLNHFCHSKIGMDCIRTST